MSNGNSKHDLILKLLAKAESTTPAEAEALMEKAEELMIRYGIEQMELDAARRKAEGREDEQIVKKSVTYTGVSYAKAQVYIGADVARALGLGTFYTQYGDGKRYTLHVVGFESDVDHAHTLIASLQQQAQIALRLWWKDHRHTMWYGATAMEQLREKRQFLQSFGTGAWSRIKETRKRVEDEYKGTGTEVALVDRKRKLDQHMRGYALGRGRGMASGSSTANGAGFAAGRSADVGAARLSGTRGAIGR